MSRPKDVLDVVCLNDRGNPADFYLRFLAESGKPSVRTALNQIAAQLSDGRLDAETLEWQRLRYADTKAIQQMLIDAGYAPSSCRAKMAALRGVLKTAMDLGLMNRDSYLRAVSLPLVRGSNLPSSHALSRDDTKRLFDACAKDPGPSGRRDAAAFALMIGWGLRRSEAVAIELENLGSDQSILLTGKGGRRRKTYGLRNAREAIIDWLAERGIAPGPLLCPVRKGGQVAVGVWMTPQALHKRLKIRAAEAGIDPCSPKDLRCTHVTNLLLAGVALNAVQGQVGHSRMITVGRYDRRQPYTLQQTLAKTHLPYVDPLRHTGRLGHQPAGSAPSGERTQAADFQDIAGAGARRNKTHERHSSRRVDHEREKYHKASRERIATTCIREKIPPESTDPVRAYLDTLSPDGRRAARSALNGVAAMATGGQANAETLAWERLQHRDTAGIRALLIDADYAPSSCRTKIGVLRGVLKSAWRLELMDTENYQMAVSLGSILGSNDSASGHALSIDELRRLFEACARDSNAAGRRDAAAFALMAGWGLRPSETVALELRDLNEHDGIIRLFGRGCIEREVLPLNGATRALTAWLAVRGRDSGCMLCHVRKGGQAVPGVRMTTQALAKRLSLRVVQADIEHCSPKDMRRTYITQLLNSGLDHLAVQKMAGYMSAQTTALYDGSRERAERAAAEIMDDLLKPSIPGGHSERRMPQEEATGTAATHVGTEGESRRTA